MLLIDYLIVGVVAVSALIGLLRGFFPELISLLSWVVAIWSGWQFSGLVEPLLAGKLNSPALELWLSRAAIFVSVLLIGGLIGQLVTLLIRKTGLSGTDRALGFAFGLARGAVILGAAVLFAGIVDLEKEPWWKQSRMIPYGEAVARTMHHMLPEQVSRHLPPIPESSADSQPAG